MHSVLLAGSSQSWSLTLIKCGFFSNPRYFGNLNKTARKTTLAPVFLRRCTSWRKLQIKSNPETQICLDWKTLKKIYKLRIIRRIFSRSASSMILISLAPQSLERGLPLCGGFVLCQFVGTSLIPNQTTPQISPCVGFLKPKGEAQELPAGWICLGSHPVAVSVSELNQPTPPNPKLHVRLSFLNVWWWNDENGKNCGTIKSPLDFILPVPANFSWHLPVGVKMLAVRWNVIAAGKFQI